MLIFKSAQVIEQYVMFVFLFVQTVVNNRIGNTKYDIAPIPNILKYTQRQ